MGGFMDKVKTSPTSAPAAATATRSTAASTLMIFGTDFLTHRRSFPAT
jgi:hypothetical protein